MKPVPLPPRPMSRREADAIAETLENAERAARDNGYLEKAQLFMHGRALLDPDRMGMVRRSPALADGLRKLETEASDFCAYVWNETNKDLAR
jgi:hypothetical protein